MKLPRFARKGLPWFSRQRLVLRVLFLLLTLSFVAAVLVFVLWVLPAGGGMIVVPAGVAAIPRIGAPAPEFQVATLDGGMVSLQDYRGKVVLLNFWATWCIPCRTELPDLNQAYREQEDKGLVVLAADVREGEEDIRRFLNEIPISFPVLLDVNGIIFNRYAVPALPTSFFIDEDGVIRGVLVGTTNYGAVITKLEQMHEDRTTSSPR